MKRSNQMKQHGILLSLLVVILVSSCVFISACTTGPVANNTPPRGSGGYGGSWVQDNPEPAFLLTLSDGGAATVELVNRAEDTKGTVTNHVVKGAWSETAPGVITVTYDAPVSGEPRSMEVRFADGRGVVERLTGVNGTELTNTTTPDEKKIHLVRRDPGSIKLPNAV